MTTQNMHVNELSNLNNIKIGNVSINSKVISAPMAGITDFVLRKLIRKYLKDCLLVRKHLCSALIPS